MMYFGQIEDIATCITGKIDGYDKKKKDLSGSLNWEKMIPNKQEETRNGYRSSADAKSTKWRRKMKKKNNNEDNEEEEYGNERE